MKTTPSPQARLQESQRIEDGRSAATDAQLTGKQWAEQRASYYELAYLCHYWNGLSEEQRRACIAFDLAVAATCGRQRLGRVAGTYLELAERAQTDPDAARLLEDTLSFLRGAEWRIMQAATFADDCVEVYRATGGTLPARGSLAGFPDAKR